MVKRDISKYCKKSAFLDAEMTVADDEDKPDKIIYMNVWETIRVDMEMHRRGAKQVSSVDISRNLS